MAPMRPPTTEELQQVAKLISDVVHVGAPVVGFTAPLLASSMRSLKEAFSTVFGEESQTIPEMLAEVSQRQAAIQANQAAIDALFKRLLVVVNTVDVTPHGTPVPTP